MVTLNDYSPSITLTYIADLTYDEIRLKIEVGGHQLPKAALIVGLWFTPYSTLMPSGATVDGDWLCGAWRDKSELMIRWRTRVHLSPWTDARSTHRDTKLWHIEQSPWVSNLEAVQRCQVMAEKTAGTFGSDVDCMLVLGGAKKLIDTLQSDNAPTWLNFA